MHAEGLGHDLHLPDAAGLSVAAPGVEVLLGGGFREGIKGVRNRSRNNRSLRRVGVPDIGS